MQQLPLSAYFSTTLPAATAYPAGLAFGRLYFIVGLCFGCVLIGLIPVGQVPDEPAHFWRAYQLCRNHLIGEKNGDASSGGHLPVNVASLAPITTRLIAQPDRKLRLAEYEGDWNLHVDRNPVHRIYVDFHSYVVYSPIGYVPQILGVKVAELFSDRLLVLFYSARLCNLLVALIITYLALCLAPCAHASICILALCPSTFTQMCSASADAVTNSCALLFFALFLRAAVSPTSLRVRDYLGLFAPLLVVTQMKFPYVCLVLLLLAVPVAVYGSSRRRWMVVGGMGGACFVAYLGWYAVVHRLSVPGRPVSGISVPGQLIFIVHHPWHFLGALFHSINLYGWENAQQAVGVFGWLEVHMPIPFYVSYLVFLFATFSMEVMPPALILIRARFWAAAASGLSLLTVFAFIYMYWDPVGAADIEGFQGRYMIPLILPLTLLFNMRETRDVRDLRPRLLFTGVVGIVGLLLTVLTVATRFYPL